MFGLRKMLGSVFLAVFFLARAYIAMVFYNSDQKQKETIINNDFIQKGKAAIVGVANVTENVATAEPARNPVVEKKMTDAIKNIDWKGLLQKLGSTSSKTVDDSAEPLNPNFTPVSSEGETSKNNSGFWSKLVNLVKDEWASFNNSSTSPENNLK